MAQMGFSEFTKKASFKLDELVRKTNFVMATEIIELTPIDTGKARGNWFSSINKPSTAVAEVGEHNSEIDAAKALFTPRGATFYFVNNLPYIGRLEDGHSGQAPYGMVTTTVLRFQSIVKAQIRDLK